MFISALDSYFAYVKKRLVTIGATVEINGATIPQPIGGMAAATDWPEIGITEGGLYLLLQRIVPGGKSKTQRQYTFFCQWAWLLMGTDIGAAQEANNRGDRVRSDMQICQNLKEANYPGFCQKIDYSVSSEGVMSGVAVGVPLEMVLWDEPSFMPRLDSQRSGVLYNAATVQLSAFEDMQFADSITLANTQGPQIA